MGKYRGVIISLGILIVIALAFSGCIYMSMNGLPWRIQQTKTVAQKYLSEKYPELKYKVNKSYYNPKFGDYVCSVTTVENMPVTFEVTVMDKNKIEDNYFESKVNIEAKNMVFSLIQESEPNIKIIQISVLEDAGANANSKSYSKYKSFTPEDSYPLKIDIIWNDDEMSLDSFIDKTINIREIFSKNNISVCGLYIKDNTNGYVIDLNGRMVNGTMEGNYNYTKDEVIANKVAYKMEKVE